MKAEHLPVLSKWATAAKPDEIKGLKLIQAILKYKGTKRFRAKYVEKDDKAVFLSEQIDVEEAQDRLKKKYCTSSYTGEYCSKAASKETGDTAVLMYKKYSELPFAVILTDVAKSSLDSWLSLNDLEVYKSSVLNTLRSLFALVRIHSVSKSSYCNQFQYDKASVTNAERVDKRLFASTAVAINSTRPPKSKEEEPAEIHEKPMAVSTSLLKPSAIKDELLKGNGYITASCFVPDKVSNYQATFKNPILGANQVKRIVCDSNTSMATGGICPDPGIVSKLTPIMG